MRGERSGFAGAECRRRGTGSAHAPSLLMGVSSLVLACAGAPAGSQAPASAATGPASPEPVVSAAPRSTPVAGNRQVSLVYQAPAACPGPDSYVRQVESRATALSIELQPAEPV